MVDNKELLIKELAAVMANKWKTVEPFPAPIWPQIAKEVVEYLEAKNN